MAARTDVDYSKTSEELNNWFELANPIFMLIVIGIYLLLVYKCLPAYMRDRRPYQLKTYIAIYNILQIISCIFVIKSIFGLISTDALKFWKCSFFESNSRQEYVLNRIIRFAFWLKAIELSETIVFLLRKKYNQVSWLHVFHHSATLTLIFLLSRHHHGGTALYPLFLNSIVHAIMYSYYFVAAVCDEKIVRRLLPLKKSITTIQMIQFSMILMQVFSLTPRCGVNPIIVTYYSFVISVMFYGFYDFYRKNYTPKADSQRSEHKKAARQE